METKTVANVEFYLPKVTILQASPLLVGELAGRIAYDSFNNSEHEVIRNFDTSRVSELDASSSELLTSLAWVHHHHSVLEHLSISYLIEGTDRGTLQEMVRHRIAAYTVRSTRYTMSSVLNAYIAASITYQSVSPVSAMSLFTDIVSSLDTLVYADAEYIAIECRTMYEKLCQQTGDNYGDMLSKDGKQKLADNKDLKGLELFKLLQTAKKKRNVGDAYKHIVTDNWKVDMVVTMNLRALKNYLDLRDSGAAYEHIRWLAQAIKAVTPSKYLDLIVKG